MGQCDPEGAAQTRLLTAEVDELALLFAGEPEEKVAYLLDAVGDGLGDELAGVVKDLFIQAVLRRKAVIERNAMPVKPQ